MNVVITGASGGIGYQSALKMAVDGHSVFAIARRKDQLMKLKEESHGLNKDAKLHLLTGDLADEKFLSSAIQEILSQVAEIHVLINNAGMLVNKPFEEITLNDWTAIYTTNVFAMANLVKALLPVFSKSVRNHIVNISSMGGFQGSMKFKGLSAYSSSKAAVVGLTECMAEEFKDKNIAVNCLCLGSVQTEMFSNAFPTYTAALTAEEAGKFVSEFALEGSKLFNGKIIPVSNSTP